MEYPDLVGQRFGLLTVVRPAPSKPYGGRSWLCRCDCGAEREVSSGSLVRKTGGSRSCGCVAAKKFVKHSTTHGLYYTRIRRVLDRMKERCYYDKHPYFSYYGCRGIKVCDRWLHGAEGKTGLECFLADMGDLPSPSHSIDRIDNDGDYTPDNCRWVPKSQQARNRRNSIILTLNGVSKPLTQWSDDTGISAHILRNRYYDGWSHDAILTHPTKAQGR